MQPQGEARKEWAEQIRHSKRYEIADIRKALEAVENETSVEYWIDNRFADASDILQLVADKLREMES